MSEAPSSAAWFALAVPIRFGDCDPAGILYYPRYFDLFHQTMEAWFDGPLGWPYADFLRGEGLGLPAVHAACDYRAPTAYGEVVQVRQRVARLGTTSIAFEYEVVGADGAVRAVGETVCVVMGLDPARSDHRRPAPIPDALRARIARFDP